MEWFPGPGARGNFSKCCVGGLRGENVDLRDVAFGEAGAALGLSGGCCLIGHGS